MKCPKCKTHGELFIIDEEITESHTHINDDNIADYKTYVGTNFLGIRATWIRCNACGEEWYYERDKNDKLSIVGLRL